MPTTVTFRTDPDVDKALAELGADGRDRSQVIREAILLANRLRRRERLRAEALELANDPVNQAEIRAVREELDAIRAW
jgi:predicted transcriptional regulator